MARRCIAVLIVALLLFGSSGASADPGNWSQLIQIIAWLQQIDSTLKNINGVTEDIRHKLGVVYPGRALQKIETLFEPVDSVEQELKKLACSWRFTPRVEKLRLGLFGGGSFCRSDWNLLFGPPVPTVDWDLESYYDWSAVRRLNLIKTRNEKSEQRATEAALLAYEAIQGRDPADPTKPYSPGYSQRLSALGAAQLGNVMVEMGDTQTAMLELDQEALNDKRRRRLLDHQTAALVYMDMSLRQGAGVDPRDALLGGLP
jgi:hypothetical protein